MDTRNHNELAEYFFRVEYGKIVAVILKYIGHENLLTAEDIVQETLLKAVSYWQLKGIPENPQAWLYTTAKNLTINFLRRKNIELSYKSSLFDQQPNSLHSDTLTFSEEEIADEQLRMIFYCCHPSISEKAQLALILKILGGFSISEIANAFFSKPETINKRLVRARKQLRTKFSPEENIQLEERLPVVLKTIYLLFSEGYYPSQREKIIRYDMCLEAIRLAKIIAEHPHIEQKAECNALLALMYLNASRFEARMNADNALIEMADQDRKRWNQDLINRGLSYLDIATQDKRVSLYLILATISAHHCIAPNLAQTNWKEIVALYDALLELDQAPIIQLNRAVALAKAEGNSVAIATLQAMKDSTSMHANHMFHATLGELYRTSQNKAKAIEHFQIAERSARTMRDKAFLNRKLQAIVPIDPA